MLKNDENVKQGGWADPPVMKRGVIRQRGSYELQNSNSRMKFAPNGRPLNPVGRTGMQNRGLLGKWGANFTADPIVTRYNYDKEGFPLEVVIIKRGDTGAWAIPGGMVDPGECVSMTLRREFDEEAVNVTTEEEKETCRKILEELFASENAQELYVGYVDDPRNTDNAWLETKAVNFHCTKEQAEFLQLKSGDDAVAVQWTEVNKENPIFEGFYANHKDFIFSVLKFRPQHDRQKG